MKRDHGFGLFIGIGVAIVFDLLLVAIVMAF